MSTDVLLAWEVWPVVNHPHYILSTARPHTTLSQRLRLSTVRRSAAWSVGQQPQYVSSIIGKSFEPRRLHCRRTAKRRVHHSSVNFTLTNDSQVRLERTVQFSLKRSKVAASTWRRRIKSTHARSSWIRATIKLSLALLIDNLILIYTACPYLMQHQRRQQTNVQLTDFMRVAHI